MRDAITRRSGGGAAVLAAGLAIICLAPATALAGDGAGAILKDCEADGQIDGTYPPAAYAKALSALPTDLDEYSDCRSAIRSAQLRAAGAAKTRSAPSSGGEGSAAATAGAGGGGGGRPSSGARAAGPSSATGPPAGGTSAGGSPGSPAPDASASASPAAPVRAAPAVPVDATAHDAAVSPAQVAGGLALLALAVALAGAFGPRYLRRAR